MRIFFSFIVFIFWSQFSFTQNITGNWKGNIQVSNKQIAIVFHFTKYSNRLISGKWDSPSQKAKNLPCSEVSINDDSVLIGLKIISGFYKGKFVNADSISGIWHQGNGALSLNLKKFIDTSTALLYPNEKEIFITATDGNKIYGTLLSKSSQQKLAIIIAGSGLTDRDGNNPAGNDKANSYKLLAQALDSQNIATFRFDKRAVGESIAPDFQESKLVFDDYMNDTEKIFEYLHNTLGFKNIYFIGHSEGSLVGMLAAEKTNARGYISLAGAGRPIDEIIEEQIKRQPMEDSLKKKVAYIFNELKNGREVNYVPVTLNSLFRKSVQPYMMSWLKYSPSVEIKKLNCPVLILQGSCDIQVKTEDAENLHNANKKSTLAIIPLMTHTLKNAEADCKDDNYKTYTDPLLPLNKELINDIVKFIKD